MAKPTVGAPIPLKPATALRISGESNRPATKASRRRQSSASLGGKSPPTMPLIPAMRPLKNISSTTENPIRAPPITADRNGCMNNPPLAWLAYFESRLGAKTENMRPVRVDFCCKEVSSERARSHWGVEERPFIAACTQMNPTSVFSRRKFSAKMFRQLFDQTSGTYSYLLASRAGGEALIIDPLLEKVDRYLQLVKELDLKLVKAVDTHLHADHITGLGALRDRTHCITVMGEQTKADVVSMWLSDGGKLTIEGLALDVIYTPGHTDDSYSFVLPDRVFTGDTLLIRGTGRTDFQNGDPRQQYES